MRQIIKLASVPDNSIILKNFREVDYFDSFQIQKQTQDSIDKITSDSFRSPEWVGGLMRIRNILVAFWGLKTGDAKDVNLAEYYPIGSRAVYFTVIDRNENEIVMAENDKHLNFRVSVMTIKQGDSMAIIVTTIVKYNNLLGWLYFLFVKPFHRLIIRSMLKRQ